MPGRITELSESQIVADALAELRRLRRALAASQMPTWTHDRFVVAGTPATTYQLTSIPYGVNVLARTTSGGTTSAVFAEGTDFTVDYSTGIVTVSATLAASDIIYVSYVTTGDLTALSGPVITGVPPTFKNATTAGTTSFTSSLAVSSPTCATGDLLLLAFQVADGTVSGTPTGGWTLIASVNSGPTSAGDAEHYYVYTKTASSTDAAGTTYTGSAVTAGQQLTLACLSYTPGTVDVVATNGTASGGARVTSWACPTVTVTDARTLVEFFAERNGATGASFSGPGSPTTVRADVSANPAPSEFTLQRVVDESLAAAGTSTARTVTSGLGGAWASITVALSP